LIFGDNQGALALLKHAKAHQRTKQIDIAFHIAQDRIERRKIAFDYCQTDKMVADCLMKAVLYPEFEKINSAMGIVKRSFLLSKGGRVSEISNRLCSI
jgi:hypothetical protein